MESIRLVEYGKRIGRSTGAIRRWIREGAFLPHVQAVFDVGGQYHVLYDPMIEGGKGIRITKTFHVVSRDRLEWELNYLLKKKDKRVITAKEYADLLHERLTEKDIKAWHSAGYKIPGIEKVYDIGEMYLKMEEGCDPDLIDDSELIIPKNIDEGERYIRDYYKQSKNIFNNAKKHGYGTNSE